MWRKMEIGLFSSRDHYTKGEIYLDTPGIEGWMGPRADSEVAG